MTEELRWLRERVAWLENALAKRLGEIPMAQFSALNDRLQDYANAHLGDLPPDLERMLTELDLLINGP